MARFLFTFEPSVTKRIINNTEDAECFYQVTGSTYPAAVNKILRLKLPNIDSESDMKLISIQEETAIEISGGNDEQEVEG